MALAWLFAQGDNIAPIPGAKRVARVEANTAADRIEPSAAQIERLNSLTPASRRTPRRGEHGRRRPLSGSHECDGGSGNG